VGEEAFLDAFSPAAGILLLLLLRQQLLQMMCAHWPLLRSAASPLVQQA
jgi:hypothetical protein